MFGQLSLQFAMPSLSESVSATPQPHTPGAILFGSFGQPSIRSQVPSPSPSGRAGCVHTPPTTTSEVQGLPSSTHGIELPTQRQSAVITSPEVFALPSSQIEPI